MVEDDSIDPVSSAETVARLTVPDEWEDGFLRPDALRRDDLMYRTRGWSVQRTGCTTIEIAHEICEHLGKDVATALAAVAKVEHVRRLADEQGQQCAFVVDNPLSGNDGHALTFAREGMKRGEVKRLKERLISLFNKALPLDQAFNHVM